ncbi:hypothetical protein [Paramicrobacterium chengjingii]|uniref:SnoaL-like domain-containing protein n=1 Tax=Paramicrobacterium chengjingii TaxID=2769067 RepID=A0ABX6YMQ8_9MICO|nr:hypothetical protein [Microbacterium chengjingii]QPZ39587.1 hypothetical protein HCR76_05895 [Microbacterium chengjingii]
MDANRAEIAFPTDCGNSPRLIIVSEFSAAWALTDTDAVTERLAEGARWELVGGQTGNGDEATQIPWPTFEPELVEILSTVTHGRLAACDGYITNGESRIDFCHMVRFTGAAKSAKIAEIRTFLETSRST